MKEKNVTPPTIVQLLFVISGLIFLLIILILRYLFVNFYIDLNVIIIISYFLFVITNLIVIIYEFQNFYLFYNLYQQKKFKNPVRLGFSYIGNILFFIMIVITIVIYFERTLQYFALNGRGLRDLVFLYLSSYLLHFTGLYIVCGISEKFRNKT